MCTKPLKALMLLSDVYVPSLQGTPFACDYMTPCVLPVIRHLGAYEEQHARFVHRK